MQAIPPKVCEIFVLLPEMRGRSPQLGTMLEGMSLMSADVC